MSVPRRAAALDSQDQLGRDARALAVTLETAAILAHELAHRPCDQMLGVIGDRFFELDPGLRQPGHIDGEYQRFHAACLDQSPVS